MGISASKDGNEDDGHDTIPSTRGQAMHRHQYDEPIPRGGSRPEGALIGAGVGNGGGNGGHMNTVTGTGTNIPGGNITAATNDTGLDGANSFDEDMDNIVPTVFKWEHGGRNVYITGTFNNWERQIPMHRSGNDFSYVHNLHRGKHAFKFIVDDEWRFAPDQPTVADIEGRINNFIDVSDFAPYVGDDNFFEKSKERKIPEEEYRQIIPDLDDYTKEPPALPPHLRHIILNKPSPTTDPLALPTPQAVSLNHLYCTAIKDGMMVLGATQRYREKHFTVVFYSVMPSSSS